MKCPTCKGTGEVTVTGGASDEKIPDLCPECEGAGVR